MNKKVLILSVSSDLVRISQFSNVVKSIFYKSFSENTLIIDIKKYR